MTNRNTLGRTPKQYLPYYDINSDFNTNSPSYYDYLARLNYTIQLLIDRLNEFDYAKLDLEDTLSINLIKEIIESEDLDIDRVVKISSNLKVANITKEVELLEKVYKLGNAIEVGKSGVYTPDYKEVLKDLDLKIESMDNSIPCKLESISPYIEVTKKGENHFQLSTQALELEIEEIKKKLEEGGGDEGYMGNIPGYEFEYISGNNGIVEYTADAVSNVYFNEKENYSYKNGQIKVFTGKNDSESNISMMNLEAVRGLKSLIAYNFVIDIHNSTGITKTLNFKYDTPVYFESELAYNDTLKVNGNTKKRFHFTGYTNEKSKIIKFYIREGKELD